MNTVEKIADRGNRETDGVRDNWITCADGFKLSVIAGAGAYSSPRVAFASMFLPNIHEVPAAYQGPFTHVEVGYPSERPEPWACHHERNDYGYTYEDGTREESSYCKERPTEPDDCTGWNCYADGGGDDHATVYGYVPVSMVLALIASHGGEA